MRLSLDRIAAATGAVGELPEPSPEVVGVCTDSRMVEPGQLFVCLPGSRFDGHYFAADAAAKGAAAILSQMPLPDVTDTPVLFVTDTVAALGKLAAAWRAQTRAKVTAVTGSAGKTTLKEMLAQVLSRHMDVAKNYKNFNNQIGLPLTILAATGEEGAWVLELGISKPGDMAELAPVARPDVAVIHNVGPAHLEGLGDLAGVARAKAELLGSLKAGGTAIVSRDYPELLAAAGEYDVRLTTISALDESADFSCFFLGPSQDGEGGLFRFTRRGGETVEAELPYLGSHLAENMAAVAAAADAHGLSLDENVAGLAEPVCVEQRFQRRRLGDFEIIDDSYNANPLSVAVAVDCAASLAGGRGCPLVLVLGDMLELGGGEEAAHEELGRRLAECSGQAVIYRGGQAEAVRRGLAGAKTLAEVETGEDFLRAWRDLGIEGGVVLFKGSRSCRMEELHQALCRELARREDET
ncbi:UDP-N-acetylmuramoyl-tripeptide--D-alanyl-D-alanine ligase [Desulfohalovibrio reitneri]|uniref:UDP-N-acetylmuramoyl-tripeptide--D-alanyl-D- alanine ligase n=1 Tax=Desulfohalovibrio reitneri TaxID=1307759 RepID=UPI0004A70326|nr:UDP-N-acetylmuramoyl-tripeptide--D-alanyl-D-alanine ligase [Desulfohalovibrio reitneri]